MLELLVNCFSVLLGGYSINNEILRNIECPKKRSTVSHKMSTCPKKNLIFGYSTTRQTHFECIFVGQRNAFWDTQYKQSLKENVVDVPSYHRDCLVCLFVCQSVCSFVHTSVCLSVRPSVRLSVWSSIRLSIRLSVQLSKRCN